MSPVGRCYKCQIVEQAYAATIAWFTAIFKSARSGYRLIHYLMVAMIQLMGSP